MNGQLLQIAQIGHPILRKKARIVTDIQDPLIQQLISDLLSSLMDVNGVGMAAPQVYQSYRLFIVASHPNPRYPNAPLMDPTPIINQKIISHNREIVKDWEGCLSIPGIRGLIPRFTEITTTYTDQYGKQRKQKFTGFIARIFQHEYDHLNGILFLDRIKNNSEIISDKEYLKRISEK